MNQDFRDVLAALLRAAARFLVVGAHAMAVHGVPRATGDLAVWVDPAPHNAERVWQALLEFGAPVAAPFEAEPRDAGAGDSDGPTAAAH